MSEAIRKIAVIGSGTMGAGIAIAAARSGLPVTMIDQSTASLARARAEADRFFRRQVETGRMLASEAEEAGARILVGGNFADLEAADLVIEAIFEDFDCKTALFREISGFLREDSIVATNTSCLKVGDLAIAVSRPERFLGLHYFSPAAINPVVEVVRGERTAPSAVDAALDYCRRTNKIPILCKDSRGFAINRFFCPYSNEAVRCLDEGLGTAGQIDWVARHLLAAAAGPFAVMNIIRPRVNLHAIRNLEPLGSFYRPAEGLIELGEAGGDWAIAPTDPASSERAEAIDDRLTGALFFPVLQSLDEAVAKPEQIDLGARQALKFGRGPCALMDELGRVEVARRVALVIRGTEMKMPASIDRVGFLIGVEALS